MLVAVAATHAQTPTATLSHEGTVKCFYGQQAFVNAVAQAADGDKITLSSGLFTGTDITKSITVKGAGMSADTINHIEPTVISTDYSINAPDVTIEGLNMAGNVNVAKMDNVKMIKCTFSKRLGKSNAAPQAGFVRQYLVNSKCLGNVWVAHDSIDFYIDNSFITNGTDNYGLYNKTSTSSPKKNHIEAINSIIAIPHGLNGSYIYNSSFTNCILTAFENTSSYSLSASNYAYYCLGVGSSSMFSKIIGTYGSVIDETNKTEIDYSKIFKTYRLNNSSYTYTDYETLELTSTAASTYLGDDGTQVGIYGGSMPFNPKPNNPYITKCTVAEKSTPQGTLSVDIEVRPAQ